MLENIISGLILALISSMAFVAYRHPAAYKEIYEKILPGATIGMAIIGIGYMGFQLGYIVAAYNIRTKLKLDLPADDRVFNPPGLGRYLWFIAGFSAIYLYLLVLSKLPQILKLPIDRKNEKEKQTE
jgi:hypothetical protein